MQSTSVPAKFPIPFASSAGGLYTRTIPQASQIGIQDGAASLTDGFPPKCFVPVASGGTPPFGKDFNGLLKQVTQWDQWQQAGGPIVYDSSFQSAIGGYPMGAIIEIVAGGPAFMSTVENNTVAPAVGATGWIPVPTFGANVTTVTASETLAVYNAGLILVNAAAGNITITMPAVAGANGVPLPFNFVRLDSSANSVTINAAGTDKFQPSNSTSLSIGVGGAMPLSGDGSSAWRQIGTFVGGILIKETTFQASGTWTPDPRTTKIRVRMVGAGGGGGSGGGCGAGQTAVAGGGGAGAYHEFIIANPGAQTVTIGGGGAAGNNGGATSFGSISSCAGGGGAVFVNANAFTAAYNQGISGTGAAVPATITGTVVAVGGASGDPGLALRVDSAVGGAGGDSIFGGGGRYSNQSAGFNAAAPGAGGSGASVGQNTSSLTGGSGTNGILIVEEFM